MTNGAGGHAHRIDHGTSWPRHLDSIKTRFGSLAARIIRWRPLPGGRLRPMISTSGDPRASCGRSRPGLRRHDQRAHGTQPVGTDVRIARTPPAEPPTNRIDSRSEEGRPPSRLLVLPIPIPARELPLRVRDRRLLLAASTRRSPCRGPYRDRSGPSFCPIPCAKLFLDQGLITSRAPGAANRLRTVVVPASRSRTASLGETNNASSVDFVA